MKALVRRFGWVGIVFFTVKGLAWLVILGMGAWAAH